MAPEVAWHGGVAFQANAARSRWKPRASCLAHAQGAVQSHVDGPAAADQPRRGVHDAVSEVGDLAVGQVGLVVEADQFGPGDQIGGGQHAFQPGVVLGHFFAGQVTQPMALAWRIRSSTRACWR